MVFSARATWQHLLDRRPRTADDMNVLLLSAEMVFVALLSAAASFDSAFVLRAGGSNALVGLLSSIPALVAVCLYMPAARLLEGRRNYSSLVVACLLAARSGYLVVILAPWIMRQFVPEVTVATLIMMTAPSVVVNTGWTPLLADVVPAHGRASVLATRSMVHSAAVAIMTYAAGRWLDSRAFPGNYQAMYAVGLIGALVSTWLVSRIRVPDAPENEVTPKKAPRQPFIASVRLLTADYPGYRRIIVNTLLYNLGEWMIGPLYVIFFVRQLGASDGWLGTRMTLAHVGVVVGYMIWRKIIQRIGETNAIYMMLPLVAPFGLLVALFPNLSVIIALGFIINVLAPGVNLSHGILFLEQLPPGKKTQCYSFFTAW